MSLSGFLYHTGAFGTAPSGWEQARAAKLRGPACSGYAPAILSEATDQYLP
ncbi:hypothetical protein CBFG_00551 [Clostridiales bacterium 1_7_47FAA]|nr:hypothetical protein CBFG_00551 [Clostridiales bacterium 1_7_47FAA]